MAVPSGRWGEAPAVMDGQASQGKIDMVYDPARSGIDDSVGRGVVYEPVYVAYRMQFPHENLSVYQKALGFFGNIQRFLSSWSNQHAFVDHLTRAAESILFNLVEAARLRSRKKKILTLDYAVGSTWECAACLDIAVLKGLLDQALAGERKSDLLEVCKMLIGLRHSWAGPRVAEDQVPYAAGKEDSSADHLFHHERLDMYRVALEFYRWFLATESGNRLPSAFARSVEALATRIVLNIAEGNGRYAELSREGFLDTANAAAAKLATCLDMGVRRGIWSTPEAEVGKRLLVRVGQMTAQKGYAT